MFRLWMAQLSIDAKMKTNYSKTSYILTAVVQRKQLCEYRATFFLFSQFG